jgi:hypothetical protein
MRKRSRAHAARKRAGVAEPSASPARQGSVSRRGFVGLAAAFAALGVTPEARLEAFAAACCRTASGDVRRKREWHELPDLFAMFYLVFMRDWLRNANLYDTEVTPLPPATTTVPPRWECARTLDGTWNDLDYPTMGSACRHFGRNVPLASAFPDPDLHDPSPRVISTALMTRHAFIPARSLNVLAAAWIQFQVHDWFSHEEHSSAKHEVHVPTNDPWPYQRPITFPKTKCAHAGDERRRPPAYANRMPHWWDGSQLYGNTKAQNDRVREGRYGLLKVTPEGLLPVDGAGEEITGFMPNGWMGVSLLHGLFALEHNAVCEMLVRKHPSWSDDDLFDKARLVTAALLAKIHTLEWTLAVIQTDVLRAAMQTNWRGLLGRLAEVSAALQDDELLGGIVGSPTNHHTAPYAMTEEFVAVYRMHPLMPDDFAFYSNDDGAFLESQTLRDVAGHRGRQVLERYKARLDHIYYSFGVTHPGAITLQNYPKGLQELDMGDGRHLDLAAVEIVRDRERGIPRYNAFRRLLGKAPCKDFDELAADSSLAQKLRAVYGHVDRVDTLVGLLAEKPGANFAFSDTAFRIFILMASRRLKSDRFYTKPNWNEATYTKEGLQWVEDNSMATVLRRHYPALRCRLTPDQNAFRPWKPIRPVSM